MDAKQCGVEVPSELRGSMTPVPTCKLELKPSSLSHAGPHRAAVTVPGVGKAVFKWHRQHVITQPPVVELPLLVSTIANFGREDKIKCNCPDAMAGSRYHLPGCPKYGLVR